MHEAGIARAIVATLRANASGPRQLRVLVQGGHGGCQEFDAALLLHLRLVEPGLDLAGIEIVHLPQPLTCATCGRQFEAVETSEPCPQCGGSAWPTHTSERIEIEIELVGTEVL
jgi:Zn finger protein HypA/HybF involved in hydrogenase expression